MTQEATHTFVCAADSSITKPADEVPSVSILALAQRGWNHIFGNEVAASVSAWKKSDEGKDATDEQVAAYAHERRLEKLAKVMDGTLGIRAAGTPRVSGVEAIRRAVTLESLKVRLKKASLKMPTGDGTIEVAGKQYTREGLLEAEYRASRAKIDAEVERQVAFKEEVQGTAEDLFAEQD